MSDTSGVEQFKRNQREVEYFASLWILFAFVKKTGGRLPTCYKKCSKCQKPIRNDEKVLIIWADSDLYLDNYSEVHSDLFVICEPCSNENIETSLEKITSLVQVQFKDRRN